MAFTQTDYDALEQAIKSGVRSVQYNDRRVDYRDFEEMIALREMMARELGLKTGGIKKTVGKFSKGLK